MRDWLDKCLFPVAPRPRGFHPRRLLLGLGIVTVLTVAQLLRMSSSAPLNSIWAEDGSRWLTDAMRQDLWSNLRTPYAGYLETSSRLIAKGISHLPVASFAAAMAIAGALVVTGCAFVVWTASAAYIRSTPLRVGLAALVVLAPVAGVEMLANVTNTIWYLMFVSFWLLLWRPATMGRALAAAAVLTLTALSTAGVVLMLPVWLLRTIAVRTARDAVMVLALPLGLAFQISPLTHHAAGEANPLWNWDLLPAYAQRVVGGSLLGDGLGGAIWKGIGIPLEILAAAALVAILLYAVTGARTTGRSVALLALFTSLLTFFVSGYDRAVGPELLWHAGTAPTGLTRYCLVPGLLLLTAVILLVDDAGKRGARRAWAVAVGWIVIIAATSFSIGNAASRGTPRYSAALRSARTSCATGQPVGLVVISPFFFAPMQVPCQRLR